MVYLRHETNRAAADLTDWEVSTLTLTIRL